MNLRPPIVPAALAVALAVTLSAGLAAPPAAAETPTAAEARAFAAAAEARLLDLWIAAERADWVQSTYITDDTEALAAQAQQRVIAATMELAAAAKRFDGVALPPDVARKLALLKLSLALPAPADPALAAELTRITASMEGAYSKGTYCPPGKDTCLDLQELSRIMAASRDAAELADAWRGWHAIAPPLKRDFARYVELANRGARDLGYADMGAYWRAKYDMTPAAFAAEVDRLWLQVRPLYDALHAYVRHRLVEAYGAAVGRAGATSTRCSRRRAPTPVSTSRLCSRRARSTSAGWCATASASSPRSAFRRSPRRSGSAPCSPSRATARWYATPAPGTSTGRTTCG